MIILCSVTMIASILCFMTLIRQYVLCSMTLITLTRLTVSGSGIGIPEYDLQWVSNTSWVSDSNYPIHLAVHTMIAPNTSCGRWQCYRQYILLSVPALRLVVNGNDCSSASYGRSQWWLRYILFWRRYFRQLTAVG